MTPSRLAEQGFINFHRKVISRLLALILIAYFIWVRNPMQIPAHTLRAVQIVGTLLMFLSIIGRVLATISIGGRKDRVIVKTELYSVTRNPLYFASFLLSLSVGLLTGRIDFLLLIGACYLAIFYPMMLNEADYLRKRFDDFQEYESRVPLFFPNFRLWTERSDFEIHFKLVKRTLIDASLALPLIPLIILLSDYI